MTRYSEWDTEINPWTQKDRLPLLSCGLFADLIYANRPVVIDELSISCDDPAAPAVRGHTHGSAPADDQTLVLAVALS